MTKPKIRFLAASGRHGRSIANATLDNEPRYAIEERVRRTGGIKFSVELVTDEAKDERGLSLAIVAYHKDAPRGVISGRTGLHRRTTAAGRAVRFVVSLGPRRNSLVASAMDERRAVSLVVQFLHEGGFKNALTALQEETCALIFVITWRHDVAAQRDDATSKRLRVPLACQCLAPVPRIGRCPLCNRLSFPCNELCGFSPLTHALLVVLFTRTSSILPEDSSWRRCTNGAHR